MNKTWTMAITLLLFSSFMAGCAKKGDNGSSDPGSLDENATYDSVLADTGYRVSGGLTGTATSLPTGANGSAASASVVDNAMDDSAGAVDKADFLLDAKHDDGTRVQAVLRSMAAGADVGASSDHLGGAANNAQVFGPTGVGPSEFPETKAYLLLFGLSRVRIGEQSVERSQFTQVFVTKGIRNADGTLASAVDDRDLEMHVIIGNPSASGGGSAGGADNGTGNGTSNGPTNGGSSALPDGYLYYYFENVRLKQMSPEDKVNVGSQLTAPERPNVPPVVVAQVKDATGLAVSNATLKAGTAGPGNLTVTLDASNSTDTDGQIEAYSWDVRETNATGFLVPAGNQSKPSGPVVNFTFTSGGMKAINLRIIDNDGGIANTTLYFFVDYHLRGYYDFSSQQAGAVGAGTSCLPPNNCNVHSFTVSYGANKITVTRPVSAGGGGTCNSSSVRVLDPTGAVAATAPGDITDPAKLAKVGRWQVEAYWQAQANCKHNVDIFVFYTPPEAPASS